MQATKLRNISIEQYIAIERENDTRYEYHNGEIRISERRTMNHSFICGNVFVEVEMKLRAKNSSYRSLNHAIKIQIQNEKRFVYPDMVVIDKIERSKIYREAIINPIVVVGYFLKIPQATIEERSFSYTEKTKASANTF